MSDRVVSLTELEYRRRIRAYGQMTNAPEALIRATTQAGVVQLRTVRKEQPRQITVPRPLVPRAPEPEPPAPPAHLQKSGLGISHLLLDTPQGIAALLFGASLILSFQANLWSP